MRIVVAFTMFLWLMTQAATAQVPSTWDSIAATPASTASKGWASAEGVIAPSSLPAQVAVSPGTRVRVSTGPTVEVAGVVQVQGTTISGGILSSDDQTVTVRTRQDRSTVTVPRANRTIEGVITQLQPQTLLLTRQDGLVVTVPRSAIVGLEQPTGRRSRKRGAGLGLAIGAATGAGVGFLIGSSCHSDKFLGCFMQPAASTLGGVLVGGVAGTAIGAFAAPREQWEPVPVSWLDRQRPD